MYDLLFGIFHIECTYQVLKYNFPLLVFGISSISREFCPMAYMVLSHEKDEDLKKDEDFFLSPIQ